MTNGADSETRTPSPEQRAEIVVRELERFIREGKTANTGKKKGVSFRSWQAMAKEEIAQAIRAARYVKFEEERTKRRMALVVAVCVVTVGFWATTVAIDRNYGPVAAVLTGIAGLVLLAIGAEWAIRFAVARHMAEERTKMLTAIDDLDLKIRRMKKELEERKTEMETEIESDGG